MKIWTLLTLHCTTAWFASFSWINLGKDGLQTWITWNGWSRTLYRLEAFMSTNQQCQSTDVHADTAHHRKYVTKWRNNDETLKHWNVFTKCTTKPTLWHSINQCTLNECKLTDQVHVAIHGRTPLLMYSSLLADYLQKPSLNATNKKNNPCQSINH